MPLSLNGLLERARWPSAKVEVNTGRPDRSLHRTTYGDRRPQPGCSTVGATTADSPAPPGRHVAFRRLISCSAASAPRSIVGRLEPVEAIPLAQKPDAVVYT